MLKKIELAKKEIEKVIVGKGNIIEKVFMAMLSGGHVLLEDIPGVGKTTLVLAFSRILGLDFNRVQFTPDVVPSDITGFSMYDEREKNFKYNKGAAMCNMLLADEINRTSSKTQSALLEVMQEGAVTVDGKTHKVPRPFMVIGTQNPLGTAGTQRLPEAQLDRFMIQLSMGYPDFNSQIDILKARQGKEPLKDIGRVLSPEEILEAKQIVDRVFVDDKVFEYVTYLCEASRNHKEIKLGISPRGALALCGMARASAFMRGRDFVTPEDVKAIFTDTARHRIILETRVKLGDSRAEIILSEIIKDTKEPKLY